MEHLQYIIVHNLLTQNQNRLKYWTSSFYMYDVWITGTNHSAVLKINLVTYWIIQIVWCKPAMLAFWKYKITALCYSLIRFIVHMSCEHKIKIDFLKMKTSLFCVSLLTYVTIKLFHLIHYHPCIEVFPSFCNMNFKTVKVDIFARLLFSWFSQAMTKTQKETKPNLKTTLCNRVAL